MSGRRPAQGRVLGPPAATSSELLSGFLLWRNSSHVEAFAAGQRRPQPGDEFVDDLVVDEGIYQFAAAAAAGTDDVTGVDPVPTQSELPHEIITMTRVSSEQGWVGEYHESETHDHARNLDGFVSTRFFRGLHSDRIVEYVQWRSSADGTAAFDDARSAEHMSVNSHFSTGADPLFDERFTGDTTKSSPRA